MTAHDIDKLLHAIKPDGHGNFSFATRFHEEANALQELADKLHAALKFTSSPEFKGDVVGELVPWPKHHPLMLDHTGDVLNGIFVRGAEVSEWLAGHLWDEATDYVRSGFREVESPATTRLVKRMDAADLRAERAA